MVSHKTFNCLSCGTLNENVPNTRGKYCNNKCQGELRTQSIIEGWLNGKRKTVARRIVRKFLTKEKGYKCNICGLDEWQNKPITLWVDHIDGDASNNSPDNFQLVCPNCDSQQDTFGAKNYGKGRKARGLKQYG
jgi:Zn finger protein HypA/HybF involved in hydrogenase expression